MPLSSLLSHPPRTLDLAPEVERATVAHVEIDSTSTDPKECTMQDTIRNASLADLAELLRDQHARKLDMVVPASLLSSVGANLVVTGAEPVIEDDGVTSADGVYRPTTVCDEGIASRLDVPVGYLKRLRAARPDLFDENVNGLLHGGFGEPTDEHGELTFYPADARKFLLRAFRGESGVGVARALLSDQFRIIDNFDVLTAGLEGIKASGMHVDVEACDLSERRMYVRVVCPEIAALAPTLLRSYRSPFNDAGGDVARAGWSLDSGRRAAEREGLGFAPGGEPIVFAGFVLSNSEVGDGAFSITPRLVVQVCRNGLTINVDALRHVHLGGKLDVGLIKWSDDTQQKNLELVAAQARDAVSTFLDADYVTQAIERIEAQAGASIEKPADTIETIGKRLRFPQERVDGILDHFIRGGQMTAGGVLNAVTSFAQTLDDADDAMALEGQAFAAFEMAASLN